MGLFVPFQTELCEVIVHVRNSSRCRLLTFLLSSLLLEFERFLSCVELLRLISRPLQRRICVVRPKALQIGMSIRHSRRRPFLCLPQSQARREKNKDD